MGQYSPANEVSAAKYDEVNRRPNQQELVEGYAAARAAGLWRLDERRCV
jgi:uncharacterized Fe-S radical SAM superfamily protein PflX